MNYMVRLRDIANKLGISESLVSKVLSGKLGSTAVTEEKAELIRRTAGEMGYAPNLNARSLAGKPSRIIGILIDSTAPPVFFRTLAAIERIASGHGYRCMIGEAHDSLENLRGNVDIFMQYGVDGIISLAHGYPGRKTEFIRLFADYLDRMVFVGKPPHPDVAYVEIDRASAVKEAVRHLYDCGARRIAFIRGRRNWASLRQRQEGYIAGMKSLGFEEKDWRIYHYSEEIMTADAPRESFKKQIVRYILETRADGVVGLNDFIAHRLIFELAERGVRCPEDVRIVGSDNEPFTRYTIPPLTTIDSKTELQAEAVLELLLEQLSAPGKTVPRRKIITPELILRKSTQSFHKKQEVFP